MKSNLINIRMFLVLSGILLLVASAVKSISDLTFDNHLHDTYYIIPWRQVLTLAGISLLIFGGILHLRRTWKARTTSAQ